MKKKVLEKREDLIQMTAAVSDKEWTGTSGSDALIKRMRIGKTTCKDLVDYFRERASIEKEYGSKLLKLYKSMEKKAHNTNESDTLDEAIAVFIAEIELIASAHYGASQNYFECIEKLQKFHDTQKDEKKKLEENLKKSQNNKIAQYHKTMTINRVHET
ncbi:proline-serine-threonine phosphatase-interacting protein 2-like [Liolophura sinensis]|uniref:proline-serine-threonine phosphatase-interacting protein 2-like n=1 Tax=Liolophura sinensis TaxID=3198878 RepID=UPI00315803B8